MNYTIQQIASILGITPVNLHPAEISILLTDSRKLTRPSETLFLHSKPKTTMHMLS